MLPVILAILPTFVLIVMGFILRRILLKEETLWHGTEQLVYYVLFPALLFQTLARARLSESPSPALGRRC
jgi:predicted permease